MPPSAPTVETFNLTYTFPDHSTGVNDISLSLPARSRTLLIGANGAGKTTLLRLLAGKRLAPHGSIRVSGVDPFTDGLEGVTYLGLEWVLNAIVRTDIGVAELLRSVGGDVYPDRRDELVSVLDIDVDNWRMHAVSDGERRRVQLAMGLIRPWTVLLLDEITVDLDVWSRAQFLGWLRRETEIRECTIVYATHILDNLAGWPTHLVHMHLGAVKGWGPTQEMMKEIDQEEEDTKDGGDLGLVKGEQRGNSKLGQLVLRWLRDDLRERGPRSKRGPEGRSYITGGLGGYGLESKDGKHSGAPGLKEERDYLI
ncbi:ABC transporter I family member 20 [Rhypophila decipiens]